MSNRISRNISIILRSERLIAQRHLAVLRRQTGLMVMALVAGAVNLWCLYLLKRLQNKDVNLRAATTFSLNDFVSNGGIIIAGIVVFFTGSNWPDLVVGIGVACIAIYGGIEILRDAHMDIHEEEGTEHEGWRK